MTNLKEYRLNKNNHIYILKSKKFKSVGIKIIYKMKYKYDNIQAFNILCKYMGNSNAKYPSIELCNKYIENLYGTAYGIKNSFYGNVFSMTFSIKIVNPKYVSDNHLFEDAISFLHESIYHPYIVDNHLDTNIFNICKENCELDIESKKELNMGYVTHKLNTILFNGHKNVSSASALGDKYVYNKLDEYNILKYYNLLLDAPFDVYVTGDISYKQVKEIVSKYFKDKVSKRFKANAYNPVIQKQYEPVIIKKPVNQAQVVVAYTSNIFHYNPLYYALVITRLILSDTLSSKFFKVIREQMGLCYYIGATYSSTEGVFKVKTGVSSENIEKVVVEINNQIEEVKKGNITDEELNNAKEAALNSIIATDDSLFGTLDSICFCKNLNEEYDKDRLISIYSSMKKEDVIKAASSLKYCTYVALKQG